MKKIAIILTLSALCLSYPNMCYAQEVIGAPAESGNHARFVDAMAGEDLEEAIIDNLTMLLIDAMYAQDPEFARIEEQSPNFGQELRAELRPVLSDLYRRVSAMYRPQMVAVAVQIFSNEEAGGLAEFYLSPLGRRLLLASYNNMTLERRMQSVFDGRPEISGQDINGDREETIQRTIAALSTIEIESINAALRRIPGSGKLRDYNTRIAPILQARENESPNASENAAVDRVIDDLLQRHMRRN